MEGQEWRRGQVEPEFEAVKSVLEPEFEEGPHTKLPHVESPTGSSFHKRWPWSPSMWPPGCRCSDTFACKPVEPEHNLLVKLQALELVPLQGIGLDDTCPCPPPTVPMANKST